MSSLTRQSALFVSAVVVALLPDSKILAQSSGARGGLPETVSGETAFAPLPLEIAERYITIEGSAELRIQPTEIRVVLAITSEGDSAANCDEEIQSVIVKFKDALGKSGIQSDSIVTDFIAVLPRYEWTTEKRENRELVVEQRIGFRMQKNLHIAFKEESQAQAAIAKAFEYGITDIIAFDYWSRELDEAKSKALEQALKAARDKSDVLLSGLFGARPQVINLQEQTQVLYPKSLYQSFVNAYDQTLQPPSRRDVPYVRAHRPQNTYYRGPDINVDTQDGALPMKPEISVISRVRLYYESPAAKRAGQPETSLGIPKKE